MISDLAPFPWTRHPLDPPDLYARLREERPVTRVELRGGQPVWLITRYDDVRAILADPRASADLSREGFPRFGFRPPNAHERPFLRMDPPEHTVFRRLLAKCFLTKRMLALRPRIQQLVDETVDAMLAAPDHRADLVRDLALPVPSTVLSWILGVPAGDREFFNTETQALLDRENTDNKDARERALRAGKALRGYLDGLIADREALTDPGEDILGVLVTAVREGTISRQDAINTAVVLIVAGHDTTANMAALGTLLLLRHDDQRQLLTEQPELMPQAVEEMLRFLTVVHLVVLRVATEDIEIGGTVIPAGEGIIPLNFSANRDDAHYPDADRFDVHRKARDHVAFGYGVHQCLGQPLARVELEVVFGTLLRRLPGLRLAVPFDDLPFKSHAQINGVAALPVTW
ncbi:cytochrome P450 [Streptantibioticus cattleyicolor]|uniref:Cytochrome P450 n=1 Tax=Streptantibioticus cattleyicolor (strain ATCC 35852 / DSM 46488 / JCM 4925 / NBRC 14057 / NRRL 8057) TaxID=1003195 RepID=F8JKQ9_STREN|nr:cytochrome P450 [Streptantibioticus cattleyicolor]AEW98448.1 cytochrome P450 [Streptantibioticus cattleyicolor NRRL 8057 = DSM 46488]CCB72497.1 Cytochrome P450-SU2 [Streptantibioticus cattleyicolor NRRL 8057 = DSM 46488]